MMIPWLIAITTASSLLWKLRESGVGWMPREKRAVIKKPEKKRK